LTYAITVTNHGGTAAKTGMTSGRAANTTYTGEASEGWGPTCVAAPTPSPAGTPCTQAVTVPAATSPTAPGVATRTFTVTVATPLPPSTTQVTNVVTSTVGTCQEPEPQCTASNPTPPELTTTKTLASVNGNSAAPGQTVLPGDRLTYAITVENHGGTAATTTLRDDVPANTTYTGEAGEGWGPTCVAVPASPAGTPCTQAVTVGPAKSATEPTSVVVHFTVTVAAPLAPSTTQVTNVVTSAVGTCQAPEPQCTASNPTPPELTTTKTLASVNGTSAAPGQTLLPGLTLSYAVTVENHGGTAATTTLRDDVPANTTYTGEAG